MRSGLPPVPEQHSARPERRSALDSRAARSAALEPAEHPRLRRVVPPAPTFAEAAWQARRLAGPAASVAQVPALPSAEPVVQDAAAARRWAAQGAAEALQQAAERRDAAGEPLQEVAARGVPGEPRQVAEARDVGEAPQPAVRAGEVPRPEVQAAELVRPQEVRGAAVRPPEVRGAAGRLRAARGVAVPGARAALPSAVASAFHRDRVLPSPAPQQAARIARAKACFRIASRSEPWWRAVRDEVLS
jgi:hypothetical protein